MPDKLLTIEEVADILCLDRNTIRDKGFRKRHGLNIVRVGRAIRFRREEVDAFINRNVELGWEETDETDEAGEQEESRI